MRIATTPTHKFNFPEDISVEKIAEAEFVYGQNGKNILKKNLSDFDIDTEDNSLSIVLTQEETKLFAPGDALIQARIKDKSGTVIASQIIIFGVKPVLDSEEI